jgi:hypothetical protein
MEVLLFPDGERGFVPPWGTGPAPADFFTNPNYFTVITSDEKEPVKPPRRGPVGRQPPRGNCAGVPIDPRRQGCCGGTQIYSLPQPDGGTFECCVGGKVQFGVYRWTIDGWGNSGQCVLNCLYENGVEIGVATAADAGWRQTLRKCGKRVFKFPKGGLTFGTVVANYMTCSAQCNEILCGDEWKDNYDVSVAKWPLGTRGPQGRQPISK